MCSFYSSGYLVFPLALENSFGRMLNVGLEFASQRRHVQGFVLTPGWVVSLIVFILPALKSPFLRSPSNLATVTVEIGYSFLKWPALSMRSQSFENHGVSSQYPCNMPKIHEANPPFWQSRWFCQVMASPENHPTIHHFCLC